MLDKNQSWARIKSRYCMYCTFDHSDIKCFLFYFFYLPVNQIAIWAKHAKQTNLGKISVSAPVCSIYPCIFHISLISLRWSRSQWLESQFITGHSFAAHNSCVKSVHLTACIWDVYGNQKRSRENVSDSTQTVTRAQDWLSDPGAVRHKPEPQNSSIVKNCLSNTVTMCQV